MIAWIKRYRLWILAGIGLLLFVVGLVCGWKWAQALGVVGAGAAGATGLGHTVAPDPMIDGARKTVGDTLEAKKRRQEEAARIRKEMER